MLSIIEKLQLQDIIDNLNEDEKTIVQAIIQHAPTRESSKLMCDILEMAVRRINGERNLRNA